jgi:hypothetical protein
MSFRASPTGARMNRIRLLSAIVVAHLLCPSVGTSEPSDAETIDPTLAFVGTWNVVISTPIGKQLVRLEISSHNGHLAGTSTREDETVNFVDPKVDGNRLTWTQSVTKPFHMNIKFDVHIAGNEISGTSKPSWLPSSRLEGQRLVSPGGSTQ